MNAEGTAPAAVPVSDFGQLTPFRLLVENVQDYAIFMLSPGGRVASWNAGAARIKGYTAGEIVGKHFSTFYPQEAVDRGWPQQELALAAERGRFEDEGWRVRKDGTMFWANVVITALRDDTGTLVGYSKITRDLTERRRQEEALRQSEERFRLLVDGVTEYAICMLDLDGRVMSWNAGATRILGYDSGEIIGQGFYRFYPPADVAAGEPERALGVALSTGRYESEGWRMRKDGSRFWAHCSLSVLRDGKGATCGYAEVTRDMTERKRVEELEYEGRNMNEFLAMFGHELRNPLAPIRNAVSVMRLEGIDAKSSKVSLEVIDRQSRHLSRLVDDLLDVSRIHSGAFTLKCEPTHLSAVVAQALEAAAPLMNEYQHTVNTRIDDFDLAVNGDATRLVQLLVNLLNNAAKYTPAGGYIELSVQSARGEAVMRVRDSGIGIPAELQGSVFDLFVQGSRELARTEGGLGVGLTLVRRIAELHGGSASVHSDGPGQGAEFIVRLPALTGKRAQLPRAASHAATTRPVRAIVVDDNRDSANSMAMLLRMWGHYAVAVYDGHDALALARESPPDLVLLDLGLPEMTGFDVVRALHATPGLEGTLLVAMTGYGQESDIEQTRAAGFDHHLVKPVEEDELRRVLARAAGDVPPPPLSPHGAVQSTA